MQSKLYILLLAFVAGFTPAAYTQPVQTEKCCVRGKTQFDLASGLHSIASTYQYKITGGVVISTVKPDSVVVQWGKHRGLYSFGAQETLLDACTEGGAVGAWDSIKVELVGTPFYFAKKQRSICEGDTLRIPIDEQLYEKDKTRWRPAAAQNGIVEEGGYRVWVEDKFGCTYSDSITVKKCLPPP